MVRVPPFAQRRRTRADLEQGLPQQRAFHIRHGGTGSDGSACFVGAKDEFVGCEAHAHKLRASLPGPRSAARPATMAGWTRRVVMATPVKYATSAPGWST